MNSFARHSLSLSAGALALACAAGPALAATPITGCRVLSSPGSYVLTADIINPALNVNKACFEAIVDRVTLDLGGHTISSSNQTGTAILGLNSFAVRNGTIKGFERTVLAGSRVCRHSFEGKEGGNEVDRSGVAGIGLVVSSGDTAELLDPLEEVLDQVTPLVHLGVVRDRHFPIRLSRDDGGGGAIVQDGAHGVVVEGLVGDERAKIDALYKRLDADAVVTLARQQDKARHTAQRIDESDDLGSQPATRPADGLILSPPFAPAPCR